MPTRRSGWETPLKLELEVAEANRSPRACERHRCSLGSAARKLLIIIDLVEAAGVGLEVSVGNTQVVDSNSRKNR